jgi:hypothetical protein
MQQNIRIVTMKDQSYLNEVLIFFEKILYKEKTEENLRWIANTQQLFSLEIPTQLCLTTFSTIPRIFNKKTLQLNLTNFHPENSSIQHWSLHHIARTYFILLFAQNQPENFKKTLQNLFNSAGFEELISLYQMLFLLPNPEQFCEQAINGVRSNMATVFNAIALNNSYPSTFFDQDAWNQLVLKALFIDSEIEKIIGLKKRANPTLANMLRDYAKERSAAGRTVKVELWRIVAMCNNDL